MAKTNAQYQAEWRARRQSELEELQAEVARLRKEVELLRKDPLRKEPPPNFHDLPKTAEELLRRKQAFAEAEDKLRAERRANRRKGETVPDQKTVEEHERQIKRLKGMVKSRDAQIEVMARTGKTALNSEGWKLIRNCLSPNVNDGPKFIERRIKAFQLFTSVFPEPKF
jgi:hypothetical protein